MQDKEYFELLEKRKIAEKRRPETGELIQGIVFSLLSAQEQLKAAEILAKENLPNLAYGHFVAAVEEIGKIPGFINIIIEWQNENVKNDFLGNLTRHVYKISTAFSIANGFFDKTKIADIFQGKTSLVIMGKFVEAIIKVVDPEAAKKFHSLRLDSTYVNFDGKSSQSTYHKLGEVDSLSIALINPIVQMLIESFLKIAEKIFPDLLALIRACFFCQDETEVIRLKKEINRIARRILPAFRMAVIESALIDTGSDIENWISLPEEQQLEHFKKSPRGDELNFQRISILISSEIPIHEYFFYPPLKESAKQYYRSFANKD